MELLSTKPWNTLTNLCMWQKRLLKAQYRQISNMNSRCNSAWEKWKDKILQIPVTSYDRVLSKKLIVVQLIKIFSVFYRNWNFINLCLSVPQIWKPVQHFVTCSLFSLRWAVAPSNLKSIGSPLISCPWPYYLIIYINSHPKYVEATCGRVTLWWQQTRLTWTEINNYA